MLFHYQFEVKTLLSANEVIAKLKQLTIPYRGGVHSIFIKVSDFRFHFGKFDNNKFSCMPLPPHGNKNGFVPMIKGEVLEKEVTEIKVEVSGTWVYLIFLPCFNLCLLLSLFMEPIEWKGILAIVGIDIFVVTYFYFAATKVKTLFEELFGEKK